MWAVDPILVGPHMVVMGKKKHHPLNMDGPGQWQDLPRYIFFLLILTAFINIILTYSFKSKFLITLLWITKHLQQKEENFFSLILRKKIGERKKRNFVLNHTAYISKYLCSYIYRINTREQLIRTLLDNFKIPFYSDFLNRCYFRKVEI